MPFCPECGSPLSITVEHHVSHEHFKDEVERVSEHITEAEAIAKRALNKL